MNQNIKYDRARRNRGDDVSQVPDTAVTPESFVNLERNKGPPADHDEPGEHLQEKRPVALGNQTIKPDPESQVVCDYDQYDVKSYAEKSAVFEDQ
jgi:hypothetical protein